MDLNSVVELKGGIGGKEKKGRCVLFFTDATRRAAVVIMSRSLCVSVCVCVSVLSLQSLSK